MKLLLVPERHTYGKPKSLAGFDLLAKVANVSRGPLGAAGYTACIENLPEFVKNAYICVAYRLAELGA